MKTIFIYWDPHPVHKAWAESVNAEFESWNKKGIGFEQHLIALLQGIMHLKDNNPIYILESGMMITRLFWRILFSRKQKIIIINSDPFLTRLSSMNWIARKWFVPLLRKVDIIVSTSNLVQEGAYVSMDLSGIGTSIYDWKQVPIFIDYKKFSKIKPHKKNEWFCFIGPHLNKQKGIDIFQDVVGNLVLEKKKYYRAMLIGTLGEEIEHMSWTIITEPTAYPENFLAYCKYYMNLARFEPAGANVLEAMAAGFVPIVSEGVGVKESVRKINPKLVVQTMNLLNVDNNPYLAQRIKELLPLTRRNDYRNKARMIAKSFTKAKSIKAFREAVNL